PSAPSAPAAPSQDGRPAPPPPPPAPPIVAAAAPPICDAPDSPLITATNRDRVANGLPPLCANGQLIAIAQAAAQHMADTGVFAHQNLYDVIGQTPFTQLAENILVGPRTMSIDAMEGAFMQSPPHREHIVSPLYHAIGVGTVISPNGIVWVAVELGG